MPRQVGNDIYIRKGESLPFDVTVYDTTGVLATDISVAKLAIRYGATTNTYTCTIQGSHVYYTFAEATTLNWANDWEYEFRIKDNAGLVDSLVTGMIYVESSPISASM